MCNIAAPVQTPHTLNTAPGYYNSVWSYPFQVHSDSHDDGDDHTVEQVRNEIYTLLYVESAIEFEAYYRNRLASLLKQTRKLDNLHVAYLISVLGCKLNALDLHQEAEKLHRRALCMGVKGLGRDHPDLISSMGWLAFSLYRQGHFKEAVLLCYSMIVLVHQSVGSCHPDLANCYFHLATIVEAMGLGDHATELREKGLSLLKIFYPIPEQSYWWPSLDKGDAFSKAAVDPCWSYDPVVHYGYFPQTAEMHPAPLWIPAGYDYGCGESFVGCPVHSF